jgi:undecaprenyl-phosphate 4-deoxy-4-formamido-L-arabinose transferase
MILFVLGLIGEYIGRIYISLNNSPQFVVREALNVEEMRYAAAPRRETLPK